MVKRLVSKSIPIVHHVTIPCSESLLVSSSEGTVVAKVPSLTALGTLLLFLWVVLDLPACFDPFCILLPMCVSMLFEMRDYLPYGCLLPGPPLDVILHFLCDSVISIHTFQCLLLLYKFDALEGPLGVEASNFLDGENFLLLPMVIGIEGG